MRIRNKVRFILGERKRELVMAGTKRLTPAELTPGPWPDMASDDAPAEAARQLALRVRTALGGRSVRALARHSGVPDGTILRIMKGALWPDLRTVIVLEEAVGRDLLPSWSERLASRSALQLPEMESYIRRDESGRWGHAERIVGTWDPNARDDP